MTAHADTIRRAALALVCVMESGIYFAPEPGEADHGTRWAAEARRKHARQQMEALVELKHALEDAA